MEQTCSKLFVANGFRDRSAWFTLTKRMPLIQWQMRGN
jgi:hypothetical protein